MAENIILLTQTQSTLTNTVVELKQSRDELRQEQLEYKQRQQENDQRFYTLLQEIRHLSRRMDGQEQGERS
ncbi:MAG: hypothetical protein HC935_07640 [Pseudanabaena sp. SU_2_4]|nr:hypothetical protein [Pseudanabaena sp. SU_2_4]